MTSYYPWLFTIFMILAMFCAGCGKTENSQKTPPAAAVKEVVKQDVHKKAEPVAVRPKPSPVAILDKITALGGKYRLNKNDQVWALDLGRCAVHDDDLKILYSLPEIKTFNLRGASKSGGWLSETGLEPLRSLRKLERLDLSYNIFKVDLSPINGLPRLSYLNITSSNPKLATFGDDALKTIATLPALKKLNMSIIDCSEEGLQVLAGTPIEYLEYHLYGKYDITVLTGLKNLREWRTSFESLPSNRLAAFDGFSKLENLEILLTGEKITQAELNALASMKSLEILYIGGREDIDWGLLSVIDQLPKLKSLQLGNAPDNALTLASGSDSLEVLCLRLSNIATEDGFAPLKTFSNLKTLSVDPQQLTPDAFHSIAACESLQGVSFSTIHIDNRRSSAKKFQFENVDFTAEDMQVLFEKGNFQELNVSPVPFGDELLVALQPAENLRRLNISKSKVTNQGIAILRHFPNLESLSIFDTVIDMDVIQQLHDDFFPRCKIGDNWCCGCLSIDPILPSRDDKKEALNLAP